MQAIHNCEMNRALALEEQSPVEPPLFLILNKGTMTS